MTKVLGRAAVAAGILLISASTVFAQGRGAGLSAGVSMSTLTGDVSNTSSRTGFTAGAFWANRISTHWGFRLELNYVQKGGSGFVGTPVNEAVDLKMDYLELPLMVVFGGRLGESVVAGVNAGVSVGFNVLCEADVASEAGGFMHCDDTVVGNRNVDFTIPVGAGIGFTLPGGSILSIEARYELGLTNLAKWDGPILVATPLEADSSAPVPSVRSSTFLGILRWTIPMGNQRFE